MTQTFEAGVDEAGRGPLAGPVTVAAVILDAHRPIDGLADSKRLSASRREVLAEQIKSYALAWSVVHVTVEDIDRLNILGATLHGMTLAIQQLTPAPVRVQVDGNQIPQCACPCEAIVGGDARIAAISAASILAKVARDALMYDLDQQFPDYGFARHKGYGTREHMEYLNRFGPCDAHRRSFKPVRRLLEPLPL